MFFIPRNNKKHVSSVRDSHFVDFCAANYGQVYCTVHYILIFNELCAANYCRAYTIYCFIVKRWEMQLFFVKLRVRIDMFSIRFRIWYSYIQKRGNATPHVQELVASSVWVGQFIRVFGMFLYGSEVVPRDSRFRPDNEAQVRCGHENRA